MFIPKKNFETLLNQIGLIKSAFDEFGLELSPNNFYINLKIDSSLDHDIYYELKNNLKSNDKIPNDKLSKINKKISSISLFDEYTKDKINNNFLDLSKNHFSKSNEVNPEIQLTFKSEKLEEATIDLQNNIFFLLLNKLTENISSIEKLINFSAAFNENFVVEKKLMTDKLNFKFCIIIIYKIDKKENETEEDHTKVINEYIKNTYNEILNLLNLDLTNETNKKTFNEYFSFYFIDEKDTDKDNSKLSIFKNVSSMVSYYTFSKDLNKITLSESDCSQESFNSSLKVFREELNIINNNDSVQEMLRDIRKFISAQTKKKNKYLSSLEFESSILLKFNDSFDSLRILEMSDIKLNGKVRTKEFQMFNKIYNQLLPSSVNSENRLEEILTFSFMPKNECSNCKAKIKETDYVYHCFWCDISFCTKCIEDTIKNNTVCRNKYLHTTHNLLYCKTRNPENLCDLDKYKLGKNKFVEYNDNYLRKHHSAICNGCRGNFNTCENCQRYICVSCRPGIYRSGGFCDFCYECILRLRNGNDLNDAFGEENNHSDESHVYLMVICEAGGYSDY